MEKIIGGKDFNYQFPVKISQKILWPCYQFIAQVEGVQNNEKNILDEFILRFAKINVTSLNEIASYLGLEEDLISFMQSRLQQIGCLDDCFRITNAGEEKLDKMTENRSIDIYVYVDALTGRIIPYYSPITSDNRFKPYEADDKGKFFYYKNSSSTAGTETDDRQKAYKLQHYERNNAIPYGDKITAMLHRLYPEKDGVLAKVDLNQSKEKNLCYILLDIMQPEGSSHDWVFTNGFGKISTFFSAEHIRNKGDNDYITDLRNLNNRQTNASDKSAEPEQDKKFPELNKKRRLVQQSMKELEVLVDSPDKEDALHSAISDTSLYLTQLAEWVLYYILHEDSAQYKARKVISLYSQFNKDNSYGIIGQAAKQCAERLGFDEIDKENKGFFNRNWGQLSNAFDRNPALFPLLDILLIGLENEPWLKNFAQEHHDFLSSLIELNKSRNKSFHAGEVREIKEFKDLKEKVYAQLIVLIKNNLGCEEKDESSDLTFGERTAILNELNNAYILMEQELGVALCRTLAPNLHNFVRNMERRGTDAVSLKNTIINDQYQILEHIFVSVNKSLGNIQQYQDWKTKARDCGFELDLSQNNHEYKSLLKTKEEMVKDAIKKKPASMNAACLAFCTLADNKMLQTIADKWPKMLSDINYLTKTRGHGEIPDKIDPDRALEIKKHIIDLIKFFAEEGFLTENNVN